MDREQARIEDMERRLRGKGGAQLTHAPELPAEDFESGEVHDENNFPMDRNSERESEEDEADSYSNKGENENDYWGGENLESQRARLAAAVAEDAEIEADLHSSASSLDLIEGPEWTAAAQIQAAERGRIGRRQARIRRRRHDEKREQHRVSASRPPPALSL